MLLPATLPPRRPRPLNAHTPLRLQVMSGKDAMPAFEGVLSQQEIQAVAAYVFDQAAGDKW